AELEVIADSAAVPGTHPLRVLARAEAVPNITASLPLRLQVTPPPPTLQLAVSPKVSVYAGGKAKFEVKIARQRFEAPVRVEVRDPAGLVSAPPVIIPKDKTEAEVEISASSAALKAKLPLARPLPAVAQGQDGKGATATE